MLCAFLFSIDIHDNGNIITWTSIHTSMFSTKKEFIRNHFLQLIGKKKWGLIWSFWGIFYRDANEWIWSRISKRHKNCIREYNTSFWNFPQTNQIQPTLWRFDSLHSYSIFQKNRIWTSSNTNVILWPSSIEEYTNSQSHDILFLMDGSFDADNPWITNPPDNHPCLPGVADDDEVHLLLFLAFFSVLKN